MTLPSEFETVSEEIVAEGEQANCEIISADVDSLAAIAETPAEVDSQDRDSEGEIASESVADTVAETNINPLVDTEGVAADGEDADWLTKAVAEEAALEAATNGNQDLPAIASPANAATNNIGENFIQVEEVTLPGAEADEDDLDDTPDEVEMSLFDHLEELRQRIFYALIAVGVGIAGCFLFVKPIVQLLERPAQGVKFLQLAPGEFFFVSLKVAAYSGILVASPMILYQIVRFVLPGLTRRERRLLGPIVFGSTFLFVGGLVFAYLLLIPAALNFFISYGADVVEQLWSIDKYFEFVLLLLFSTGLAFQIPVIQALLGLLGIVTSKQMLSGWRFVILGAAIAGAILTPSTDPLTQSLLGGAVLGLYFGGIGLVKLIGR